MRLLCLIDNEGKKKNWEETGLNVKVFTYLLQQRRRRKNFKVILSCDILPEDDDTKGDRLHVKVDDYWDFNVCI